mgnify:CR=1 FL=1
MDELAFIESANVKLAIIAGEILQIMVLIVFIVLFPPFVGILTHIRNKNIISFKVMYFSNYFVKNKKIIPKTMTFFAIYVIIML